jgi:hypothetical protein
MYRKGEKVALFVHAYLDTGLELCIPCPWVLKRGLNKNYKEI